MTENTETENNARIFGILAMVLSIIPIVGLILGIIATQKGRNGKSTFAVTTGWIGIALSIIIAIAFGFLRYQIIKSNDKQANYQKCIQDRLAAFSSGGDYTVAESQCDWARP